MSEPTIDITDNKYAELCFCGELEAISIENTGVFYKVKEGNASLQKLLYGFSYADGKLTYEGTGEKMFEGTILAQIAHEGNAAREIRIRIARNVNGESLSDCSVNSGANYEKLFSAFQATLMPGDFIEIYATNAQGTEEVKIKDLKISFVSKL